MTVQEFFESDGIDLDFIETKFDGPYWEKTLSFITQVWQRDVESLTDKQSKWVHQVLDDCVEKRIEA